MRHENNLVNQAKFWKPATITVNLGEFLGHSSTLFSFPEHWLHCDDESKGLLRVLSKTMLTAIYGQFPQKHFQHAEFISVTRKNSGIVLVHIQNSHLQEHGCINQTYSYKQIMHEAMHSTRFGYTPFSVIRLWRTVLQEGVHPTITACYTYVRTRATLRYDIVWNFSCVFRHFQSWN